MPWLPLMVEFLDVFVIVTEARWARVCDAMQRDSCVRGKGTTVKRKRTGDDAEDCRYVGG